MTAPRIAALALPPIVGAAQVLLPAGPFDAPRGALQGAGPWRLPADRGQALAAALGQRGRDIPIDYEHQTLHAPRNGQPAPAAGWIQPGAIGWDPQQGLIAAAVQWTDRAAGMIAAGEYRYLSPVFSYDTDGTVRDLYHLALTNTPALDSLPEVNLAALSAIASLESPMDDIRERLLYMLNLPVTTTQEELLAHLDKLKTLLSADTTDAAAASLPDLITAQRAQIAALQAQVQTAPPSDLISDLQRQIAALSADATQRERDGLLTAAIADGRLLPDSPLHAYAKGLPLDTLRGLLPTLQPLAALGTTQTGGQAPTGDHPAPFTSALAAEFGDQATYDAFRRAETAGRIRINPRGED